MAKSIKLNSLIMACTGTLIGKVGITIIEATCNKLLVAIVPSERALVSFLYYQFQSNIITQQITNNVVNGTIIKYKIE